MVKHRKKSARALAGLNRFLPVVWPKKWPRAFSWISAVQRRWLLRFALAYLLLGCGAAVGIWATLHGLDEMEGLGCDNLPGDLVEIPTGGGDSVRFIALGDTGRGNDGQHAVADVIRRVCRDLGCDFVLMLGDNIYPRGVASVDDPAFERVFGSVYTRIDRRFYLVLGDHDTHGGGAIYQVLRTLRDSHWMMPNYSYRFSKGPVDFHAINTNCKSIAMSRLEEGLASTPGRWNVVFGHHTLYSTGPRGDGDWLTRNAWADAREEVDFYLSGHDHHLEHLVDPEGGPDYVVSGAGARANKPDQMREVGDSAMTSRFRHVGLGLVWFEFTPHKARARFFDVTGDPIYEFSRDRK